MKIVPQIKLTGLVMLVTGFAHAGPIGPPPPQIPPPPGLPIDGGLVLLVVAAISYGLYKVYHFKQNKKNPV